MNAYRLWRRTFRSQRLMAALAGAILLAAAPDLQAARIALLVIDNDSLLAHQAVREVNLPAEITVGVFTHQDLTTDGHATTFVNAADVILVDVMLNDLSQYVLDQQLLQRSRVYALRGSRDDDGLRRQGFIFDADLNAYFKHLSKENLINLVRRAAHVAIDPTITYQPVVLRPELGLYHPGAPAEFTTPEAYQQWLQTRSGFDPTAPWIGLMLFSSALIPGQVEALNHIITSIEAAGFNVLPCFGTDQQVLEKLLLDPRGRPRVDAVVAFSLKFYSAINDRVKTALLTLGVPVFNGISLFSLETGQWRADPVGIAPLDVVYTIANPEISGAIEPTPLIGKTALDQDGRQVRVHEVIDDNLALLIPRLRAWIDLNRLPNSAKRVAILYYNHSQGKQNIGASYLNVIRSLEVILRRLHQEGYGVSDLERLDEAAIQDLLLKSGLNIGSWAPGELDRLIRSDQVVRIPLVRYREWFEQLPADFKAAVVKQWGPPESAAIMRQGDDLIIPAVQLGQVVLLPEPARGWSDDPMKLYHDMTLYPHHQYIAAYLWLKQGFGAHAMIHLGTHATHEWLPGKQAGLSPSCPPEVLLSGLPNIYPYTMDDVGEGLQAKRRGRAVIIDHLIPPLERAGLYDTLAELNQLLQDYDKARSLGADTASVYRQRLQEMVERTGLTADLGITTLDEAGLDALDLYLHELKDDLIPHGLHTFGQAPDDAETANTVSAVTTHNPQADPAAIKKNLMASAPREMNHLIAALNGRYILPGEGNDPVRNPDALPSGKNFYGLSSARIPSPAAWELGKQAAAEIIDRHLKEKGSYPQKVAVVLWAVETLRNEGVNECTILHLMGIEPVWDASRRVSGVRVTPGPVLGRPRIDVLINPSGLYRDLFPDKLLFLDEAVQKAAVQTDLENFLRANTQRLQERLEQAGTPREDAARLARVRIFSEAPGSYGNRVSEMTTASGFWQKEADIAEVFTTHTGYAFGAGYWGAPARSLYAESLADVDTVIHSMSSNVYGVMDNDDMFASLGGLSQAVRHASGQTPETLVTLQRRNQQVAVEDLTKTVGRELHSRYLNPGWITGMMAENYAGAREMAHFVEYLWGWQVTVPETVDAAKWTQTFEVYVEDKYGLGLTEFFNQQNPWAYQSLTARMLEAVRKDYWDADETTTQKLATTYALNVVEKGVACCDHTCNNPMLNQMVVNLISLPGVMAPELVEKFQIAVAQAAGKPLTDQVQARQQLMDQLSQGVAEMRSASRPEKPGDDRPPDSRDPQADAAAVQEVEGYQMKPITPDDTETHLTSSGVQWFAALFILVLIFVFMLGARRQIAAALFR